MFNPLDAMSIFFGDEGIRLSSQRLPREPPAGTSAASDHDSFLLHLLRDARGHKELERHIKISLAEGTAQRKASEGKGKGAGGKADGKGKGAARDKDTPSSSSANPIESGSNGERLWPPLEVTPEDLLPALEIRPSPEMMLAIIDAAPPRSFTLKDKTRGYSALHAAVFRYPGAPAVVKRIIARHGSLHSAIMQECVAGNTPLATVLECVGPYEVTAANLLAIVRALIAANPKCAAKVRKVDGSLPLHLAAAQGLPSAVVNELIKAHPAGAKRKDDGGYLALHHALYSRAETTTIKALLAAHPAALLTKDGEGTYPLHAVVEDGCPLAVVSAMIKANKVCVEMIDHNSDMPLHAALCNGQTHDVIQVLLRANPKAARHVSSNGWLPLHYAAHRCASLETVRAIVKAFPGALEVREPEENFAPLHLAADRGDDDIFAEIYSAYPAMASENTSAGLPLHIALRSGISCQMIKLLLTAFPDGARQVDADGSLPIHLVPRYRGDKLEVTKILLRAYPASIHHVDMHGLRPADCLEDSYVAQLLFEGLGDEELVEEQAEGRRGDSMVARNARSNAEASGQMEGAEMLTLLARVRQGEAAELTENELVNLHEALKRYGEDIEQELARRPVEEALLAAHPEWMCPISQCMMRDPVKATDDHVYERKKLTAWMRKSRRSELKNGKPRPTWKSPLTGLQLSDFGLRPQVSMKKAIDAALKHEGRGKTGAVAVGSAPNSTESAAAVTTKRVRNAAGAGGNVAKKKRSAAVNDEV